MKSNQTQRGLTLVSLIFLLVLLGCIAVLALKVSPTVVEYFAIRKAIASVKKEATTVREAQAAFDKQTSVGYIDTISGKDLEITKVDGGIDISFAYPKKITLFGPVSLLIEYEGTTATKPNRKAVD